MTASRLPDPDEDHRRAASFFLMGALEAVMDDEQFLDYRGFYLKPPPSELSSYDRAWASSRMISRNRGRVLRHVALECQLLASVAQIKREQAAA